MNNLSTFFFLLLTLPLLFFSKAGAQPTNAPGSLSGFLKDKQNAPIAYATVTLLKQDGSVVNGNLSDEKGFFQITPTGTGTFQVRISAISYSEITLDNIAILPPAMDKKLGTIVLESTTTSLDAVEIVAEKMAMQLSMDKKTFNVDKDLNAIGGTATDVLQNIPSVSVDNDGNVSLRGKSNVTILIDGKPATLLGSDAAAALQSLPSSSIESVEIVTNPSAKYDAQGMGGIVNIVTKKDRRFGMNGSASVGVGTRDKYNASINLNLRNEKWNFFINSSFRAQRRISTNITERQNRLYSEGVLVNDTFFRTEENSRRQNFGSFSSVGVEYNLNSRNSFTLTENFNVHGWKNDNLADYNRYSGGGELVEQQLRNSLSDIKHFSISSSLDYKHKFLREKEELTANVTYVNSNTDREQEYTTRYLDGRGEPIFGPVLQNAPGDGGNNSLNSQVDYTLPITGIKGRFDAGGKAQLYSFSSANNPTISYPGQTPVVDSVLLNDFKYNQNVYAAYSSLSGEAGKFGYQGGLRAEYATYSGTTQSANGAKYSNEFFNLFPSMFLSYRLNNAQQAQASYTRRINRPSFWNLMPFVDLSDPQDTSMGNPGLLPEFIDHIELSVNHKTNKGHNVLVSMYYQHTKNLIERYRIFYEDGTSFRQPRNLNNGTTYGLELTARAQILPIWDATANFNFFQNIINGENIAPEVSNQGLSWFAKGNTSVRLPKQFSIQLNGTYEAPVVSLQNTTSSLWWIDLAIRKNFAANRGTLVFNVTDVFNTRKYTNIFDLPVYYQTTYRDRETRVATLTLSWRIGRSDTRAFNGRRRDSGAERTLPNRDNIRKNDEDGGF